MPTLARSKCPTKGSHCKSYRTQWEKEQLLKRQHTASLGHTRKQSQNLDPNSAGFQLQQAPKTVTPGLPLGSVFFLSQPHGMETGVPCLAACDQGSQQVTHGRAPGGQGRQERGQEAARREPQSSSGKWGYCQPFCGTGQSYYH